MMLHCTGRGSATHLAHDNVATKNLNDQELNEVVMDSDQYIVELFHSSIDTTMRSMDMLSVSVGHCGQLLVQCLLNEKKILCAGEGISAALAHMFVTQLLNRFNYERPGLPAINLSADATTLTAIASDNGFKDIYAHQIRAIGQANDLLFLIASDKSAGSSLAAVKAAHDRDMTVILFSPQENSEASALLQPDDIEVCIPSDNRARVTEVQLQLINYLSDFIDQQLFGSH